MEFDEAVVTFANGFTSVKSRAHPYVAERYGPLWVMKDGPGRSKPRVTELVASSSDLTEVLDAVMSLKMGWHALSVLHPDDGSFDKVRAFFKATGYNAKRSEGFFYHPLTNIPSCKSDPPVRLLEPHHLPIQLKWAHLFPPESRSYGVWTDDLGEMIGRVQSIPAGRNAWVSDLYVSEGRRGEGFGRALMSRLLQDDSAACIQNSVLLASSAGSRLYPHLGYQRIGTLQLFCPKSRSGLPDN